MKIKFLLVSLLFLILPFFIFLQTANSQTLSLKECITYVPKGWEWWGPIPHYSGGYSNADNFIREIVNPCLKDGIGGNKLPDAIWGPHGLETYGFVCLDSNNNGTLDSDLDTNSTNDELSICKKNFSDFVCESHDAGGGKIDNMCPQNFPSIEFPEGSGINLTNEKYFEAFFESKNKSVSTPVGSAPTPTPTLIPVATDEDPTMEVCLGNLASSSKTCDEAVDDMSNCMRFIPETDGMWSGIADIEGTERFNNLKNRIKTGFMSKFGAACIAGEKFNNFIEESGAACIAGAVDCTFISIWEVKTSGRVEKELNNEEVDSSYGTSTDVVNTDSVLNAQLDADLKKLIDAKDSAEKCGIPGFVCCERYSIAGISKPIMSETTLTIPTDGTSGDGDVTWYQKTLDWIISPFVYFFNSAKAIVLNDLTTIAPDTSPFYCVEGLRVLNENEDPVSCMCRGSVIGVLCDPIAATGTSGGEKTTCVDCSEHGIWTGIGCIDFNIETFIGKTVFGWGLGLAGIAAIFCFIYASFQMQISGNNPEKLKEAQELLTSCITGLIVIIFSVVILRIIGVDILRLPFLQ